MWQERVCLGLFFINKIPGSAHFLSSDVTLGYQTKSAASPTIALERLWCSCHLPLVGDIRDSNLVDSASSHTLVSKIKPCMSKYKQIYTVKLRMAHYISYSFFDGSLLHG